MLDIDRLMKYVYDMFTGELTAHIFQVHDEIVLQPIVYKEEYHFLGTVVRGYTDTSDEQFILKYVDGILYLQHNDNDFLVSGEYKLNIESEFKKTFRGDIDSNIILDNKYFKLFDDTIKKDEDSYFIGISPIRVGKIIAFCAITTAAWFIANFLNG